MEWENQLIQELQWSNKISNKASKELVAQEILPDWPKTVMP